MTNFTLDARLSSAASFVRAGAVLADIGTDHGYLPIFLLSRGVISSAVLSDVHVAPLKSAMKNVGAAGFSDACRFLVADGAAGFEDFGITDYAICGMGGELIAEIIAAAPQLKEESIRLILQPMSRQEKLRAALYEMGFTILEERYSYADLKYYVCLHVAYTGTPCQISNELAYLGEDVIHTADREEYLGYLGVKRRSLERAYNGRLAGGTNDGEIRSLIEKIDARVARHTNS